MEKIVFGPVPSRRLGRSLGINNIPPKVCSYSCIYCQVGFTTSSEIEPRVMYQPSELVSEVRDHVERLRRSGEQIDYVTFVPDGEPTLDVNLGEEIEGLRGLGIPIAVISNGSLCWMPEVRSALSTADWVSVKVDAADEHTWRRVNRPSPALDFDVVVDGIRRFADEFQGELCTETMLVDGVNDGEGHVAEVASFLRDVEPHIAYLAVPTRPPAVAGARPAGEGALVRAFEIFEGALPRVEYLIGYEGDAFSATGDPGADLLSITAVHPMRRSAVEDLLKRSQAGWEVVDRLLSSGALIETAWGGETFYLRRFRR